MSIQFPVNIRPVGAQNKYLHHYAVRLPDIALQRQESHCPLYILEKKMNA